MKKSIITRIRDAVTGRFVTAQEAQFRPRETVKETVSPVYQFAAGIVGERIPGAIATAAYGASTNTKDYIAYLRGARVGKVAFLRHLEAGLKKQERLEEHHEDMEAMWQEIVPAAPSIQSPPGYGRVIGAIPLHAQEKAIIDAIQSSLRTASISASDLLMGNQVSGAMIVQSLRKAGYLVVKN